MRTKNQYGLIVIVAAVVALSFQPLLEGQKAATLSHSDSSFMTDAAEGGMNEVRLGELAQQKGSSEQVRAFGKRMVEEHSRLNNELQAIAARKNVSLPSDVGITQKASDKLLSSKSGHSFDESYASSMLKDHKEDIEAFEKEANSGVDQDVKAFAAKSLPTLREHLRMANEMAQAVGAK